MYNIFLFIIILTLIIILCVKNKFSGGIILQGKEEPYKYKCYLSTVLHSITQNFLYPEAMNNLSKDKDISKSMNITYNLLKRYRNEIQDPIKVISTEKTLNLGICSLISDFKYKSGSFNGIKFLKKILQITDADYSEYKKYIYNQSLNMSYMIGTINPILYNSQKCFINIILSDNNEKAITRLRFLCTHRDSREINFPLPIIPILFFHAQSKKDPNWRHVVSYVYRSNIKSWFVYDDSHKDYSNVLTKKEFFNLELWKKTDIVNLFMYKIHIKHLLNPDDNTNLIPMEINYSIMQKYKK